MQIVVVQKDNVVVVRCVCGWCVAVSVVVTTIDTAVPAISTDTITVVVVIIAAGIVNGIGICSR